ncbi:BON domain-containing protein [Marinobacter sp. C2H3]|uniref:BON domain-containing protein n=1 Tax=Marinobacter sp. C2H3 TaxID=3119003 RepID=UPI00300EF93B
MRSKNRTAGGISMTAGWMLGLVLMLTAACASTETRQSAGEYIDDSVITTKVKQAIFSDPMLKVFQINVKTYNAVVQLSGFVDSQAAINRASVVAEGVSDVKAVRNDLQLKKP